MKYVLILKLVAFTFLPAVFLAQSPFELSEIMKGDGFIGHSPENIQWSYDGQEIYFDWNPTNDLGTTPYHYSLSKKNTEKCLNPSALIPAAPQLQRPVTQYYFNQLGNLARYSTKTRQQQIVFSSESAIGNLQQVTNPAHTYIEFEGNLFVYDDLSGSMQQLTRFLQGTPESIKETTALMRQQTELFSFIRDQQQRTDWQTNHQQKRKLPTTIYYAKNEQLQDLTVSPNEQFITFRLVTYTDDPSTNFEEFITKSGYTNELRARAKVSDNDPKCRMGIYDVKHDSTYYISFSTLSDIRKKPTYLNEYGTGEGLYEKDRSIIMHAPIMHPDGNKALIDIRSFDNKDRWIVLLDLTDGSIRELEHQHDEAWIGGPGISGWNEQHGVLDWCDNTTFYFQSEVSGYSHLYTLNLSTGEKKQLTSGKWEVHDVQLSKDKQILYILANKRHPGVRNGYKLELKNGQLTPLFEGDFGIEWTLSPDEKKWAIRYSTSTSPWDLFVADNKPGAVMQRITKSTSPAYEQLPLQAPSIIQIPTSDQLEVSARIYKPSVSNGAAVLFVHGAGYLQNAHHYWSYYAREFLFHQLLIQKGYTVLDIDYRASEGYGRDTRTAIYRHMGERDLMDYIDGKTYLVNQLGIDSNRIGIYGGSYGGFITLMGMLKTPGTFACGAALRSVTDWQHYNHEYTSNILNYPGTDPKAYKQSSPIYFADGLNGPLLMLHGMQDDNVQFQDIVRLNQRFIELGKTNYQLAVFPTEAHGFKSTVAWTEEYRRILELFETYLK